MSAASGVVVLPDSEQHRGYRVDLEQCMQQTDVDVLVGSYMTISFGA